VFEMRASERGGGWALLAGRGAISNTPGSKN